MDLTKEVSNQKSAVQPVKNYRDRRKSDSIFQQQENGRRETLRKRKVKHMRDSEISKYRLAARERKRRSRALKKSLQLYNADEQSGAKPKYRTHYVKKTVKNTYQTLPRSADEQAEVLSKLAEQALLKLQQQGASNQEFQVQNIKREEEDEEFF